MGDSEAINLTGPAAEDAAPGWRPLLRTLREVVGGTVTHGSWELHGHPRITADNASADVLLVVAAISAAMGRTCDRCGQLGRPARLESGEWAVRCGEHDPAAPIHLPPWEAIEQAEWWDDPDVGMVRVEDMTVSQCRRTIRRLLDDPADLVDEAQRHALYQAGRHRDRDAFEAALLIPADDEEQAHRAVENSPLMKALHRLLVDQEATTVIDRYGHVLDRLAEADRTDNDAGATNDDDHA